MYLPLLNGMIKWLDINAHYQERLPLSTGESISCWLLAFRTVLHFTQQYFGEKQNCAAHIAGLTEKMENFLYELAWQEQCLDILIVVVGRNERRVKGCSACGGIRD